MQAPNKTTERHNIACIMIVRAISKGYFRGGLVRIDKRSKARLASHDLQTPEFATNITISEWLFQRQIPATHRLNFSRPDATLAVSLRAQARKVPATHPRYELRSGARRGGMGQHLASAPASTASPRIRQPNQLTPNQREFHLM